jgi:hypothetical protein
MYCLESGGSLRVADWSIGENVALSCISCMHSGAVAHDPALTVFGLRLRQVMIIAFQTPPTRVHTPRSDRMRPTWQLWASRYRSVVCYETREPEHTDPVTRALSISAESSSKSRQG